MKQNPYPQDEGWPSNQQELLLKIALSDPDKACDMWQGLRPALIPDEVEISSRFILPLAYRNLMGCHSKIDTRTLDYFKKLYLRTHIENTKRLSLITSLGKVFHGAGMTPMLLKGSAMLLLYYKSPGLRPMSDIDLFVPFEKLDTALELLKSLGWQPKPGPKSGGPVTLTKSYLKWFHGYEFYNAEGQWLDLHWHIMHECCCLEADETFQQDLVDVDHDGIQLTALNPAYQLLHTVVQGARCEGFVYLRWVADAAFIIQDAGDDMDWQRLISTAKKYRLLLPVRDAMAYMKERIGIQIPGTVLGELKRLPVTKMERIEYHYKRKRIDNRLFSYWPVLWFDYSRRLQDESLVRKMAGFPKFLKEYWRIKNLAVFLRLCGTMMGKMFLNLSS